MISVQHAALLRNLLGNIRVHWSQLQKYAGVISKFVYPYFFRCGNLSQRNSVQNRLPSKVRMTNAQLGNKFEPVQSVEIASFIIHQTNDLKLTKLFYQARHFTKLIPKPCPRKLNNPHRWIFQSHFNPNFWSNNTITNTTINLCRCCSLYCVLFGIKLQATMLCAWSSHEKQFCRHKAFLFYKNATNYKQRLDCLLLCW